MSSVTVACTRILTPLRSATFSTGFLPYMWRRPCEPSPSMCAPFILAAYSSFIAAITSGSPSTLMACASSRKMKWIENTPDSGCAVEALAVDSITKSMSPVCTFCRVCASVPSWAPGY